MSQIGNTFSQFGIFFQECLNSFFLEWVTVGVFISRFGAFYLDIKVFSDYTDSRSSASGFTHIVGPGD